MAFRSHTRSFRDLLLGAFLCFCLSLSLGCTSKSSYLASATRLAESETAAFKRGCMKYENYIPDTSNLLLSPTRYVRINFHVMQRADGTGNFTEEEAKTYMTNMMYVANGNLRNGNHQMNLPHGNHTPVLPQRYQYVLTPDGGRPGDDGIYFHRDDEWCYLTNKGRDKNLFDREVLEKYAINSDTVLNVFAFSHHPDSLESSTYKDTNSGVALGTCVKIMDLKRAKVVDDMPEWFMQGLWHHELGHVFGLSHSWVKHDRCEDTPPHANCWNKGAPPCDEYSNNVMDYNTYQNAWTPCQLGIVHKNFSTLTSKQRKLIIRDWCDLDEGKSVWISGRTAWNGSKDLSGHLILESDAELRVNCRVALPEGARVVLYPGAKLILGPSGYLHNDCGGQWDGIIIKQRGDKKGAVFVSNDNSIRDSANSNDLQMVGGGI